MLYPNHSTAHNAEYQMISNMRSRVVPIETANVKRGKRICIVRIIMIFGMLLKVKDGPSRMTYWCQDCIASATDSRNTSSKAYRQRSA